MNVTNIFAGDKVREKKLTRPCWETMLRQDGYWERMRGLEESPAAGVGVLPVPVRHCRGARSPWRAPSRDAGGCQAGPRCSRCPASVPAPSRTHRHLQPKQHRQPPATAGVRGRPEGRAGLGSVRLSSGTGFFKLFRKEERNFFLCLGAVCHHLTDTHTRLSRSISSSG